MHLGIRDGTGFHSASVGKRKMVENMHRVDPRRDGQDVRARILRQPLVAQNIVAAMPRAIKEPLVAGEANLAAGAEMTGGEGATMR